MKTYKICFIADSSEIGGNETVLANVLSRLNKTAFHPSLICRAGPAANFYSSLGYSPSTPPQLGSWSRWLETFSPDCVVLTSGNGIEAGIWCRRIGVPLIYSRIGLRNEHEEVMATLAEGVLFPSRAAAQQFALRMRVKRSIIPNGVDTEIFSPPSPAVRQRLRKELGMVPEEILIGYSARLVRAKRHERLLAVLSHLLEKQIPAKLLFLAGNETSESQTIRKEIVEKIENLGLSKYVYVYSADPRDMPRFLSALDIFAFTNADEAGVPCSILEAMSMGLPVVAPDEGACSEPFRFANGELLRKANDTIGYAEAILWVVDNPSLASKIGEKNRNVVLQHFSAELMAQRYESLLTRTIHSKVLESP